MTDQDQNLLDDFKAKLRFFMQKHDRLKHEKERLIGELDKLKNEIDTLKTENERLARKYDNLKIAKVLSVTDNEKQQVKQRINRIVREIDKCIAQLNV